MFEHFILGAVQGIAEWLPVSSEGMIVLVKTAFFEGGDFEMLVRLALFLHLGTFLAALYYFRSDVKMLFKETLRYQDASDDHKKLINLIVVATLVSGALGFTLLQAFQDLEHRLGITGKGIMFAVGVLLLITGILQFVGERAEAKQVKDLHTKDNLLLGIVQGFAALPGLSRSGLTVAAFLLRGFDKAVALRLSFLLSLPIVLGGNILLNLKDGVFFSVEALVGLVSSFVFGLITIEVLMRIARKVRFGWFVLLFAALSFAAAAL